MLTHVQAIRAAIEAEGVPTYFVDVPKTPPTYRYVLVWLPATGVPAEVPVCGPGSDLEVSAGLTAVGETPEAVLALSGILRRLFGSGEPTSLSVAGRRAWLTLNDARPIDVDRDITIPDLNRHPAFSPHTYRLLSIPS